MVSCGILGLGNPQTANTRNGELGIGNTSGSLSCQSDAARSPLRHDRGTMCDFRSIKAIGVKAVVRGTRETALAGT